MEEEERRLIPSEPKRQDITNSTVVEPKKDKKVIGPIALKPLRGFC